MDDFWPELAELGLEDPESDEDFDDEAGFDSEEDDLDSEEDDEDEDDESPEPLPAVAPDVEPARLSVR